MANDLPACDFSAMTPLEYLSLGDRERIHTETLHWILGADSPFLMPARVRILETMCGLELAPGDIEAVSTESQHLDLVITLRNAALDHIVFENKLKSGEGPNQLKRFDELAAALDRCAKFYLTLIGETGRRKTNWQPITFESVERAIRAEIALSDPPRNREYIADYVEILSRLNGAVRRVLTQPDPYAAAVFGVSLRDADARDLAAFRGYVERTRLGATLQRAWMHQLGMRVAGRTGQEAWHIGETRGHALLQFEVDRLTRRGSTYAIGVQLQRQSFKVFCCPEPYAPLASREQHAEVHEVLTALRRAFDLEGRKISQQRPRGFRSFSPDGLAPAGTFALDAWITAYVRLLEQVAVSYARL